MIPFPADAPFTNPPPTSREEPAIQFAIRLLIAAYLVEAGLVLTISPWTMFWYRNYFAYVVPWLGWWMSSAYVRGAITGVGIVTAVAGMRDLSAVILARSGASDPTPRAQ